jgi:DnaD/phage-associated family protein
MNIYEYFEHKFGCLISSKHYHKLEYYSERFNDEIIKHAIDICTSKENVSINYLYGILNNYLMNKYTDLNEILVQEKEFDNKIRKKYGQTKSELNDVYKDFLKD